RAYAYQHAFMSKTSPDGAEVTKFFPNAIRVYEHDKSDVYFVEDLEPPALLTRPRMLPLRIEPNTTVREATIDMSILPQSGAAAVDRTSRPTPRDQHVWMETPNAEGGFFVTTRVGDWVVPLDLRDLRGRYTLLTELNPRDKTKKRLANQKRTLVVD